MTIATPMSPAALPSFRRLGLDDGWATFGSTFLNFGCPSIFLDRCLLPDAARLGFELLGSRPASEPLPSVAVQARILGTSIALYSASSGDLIATHECSARTGSFAIAPGQVIIMTGDSWDLELSWSALWRSRIGQTYACGRS